MSARVQLRRLGCVDYAPTAAAMQAFTAARSAVTPDEIWLCEHPPVYTQGLAGNAEHLLHPQGIPVVQTNRGGQVTYHGPGQVVAYPLVDLRRLGIYVKEYVYRLEQALLKTLECFGATGHRVAGAPGIYVRLSDPFGHAMRHAAAAADSCDASGAVGSPRSDRFAGLGKIAALGIKVSRNCTYHGVALNVAMDLRPFEGINPCGYAGLRTVDLSTIGVEVPLDAVSETLGARLAARLGA